MSSLHLLTICTAAALAWEGPAAGEEAPAAVDGTAMEVDWVRVYERAK
jgi:hypothetical protein